MPRIPMVRGCVAWVQRDSPAEFLPGRLKVPVEAIQAECERGVGFAEAIVQLQGLDRGGLGFGESLLWGHHGVLPVAQQRISVGQARVCARVSRVLVDRLTEIG